MLCVRREYQLLRRKHRLSSSKRPRCISNMPGEERWRLLELEPTRALGHANKSYGPLQSPEIYECVYVYTQAVIVVSRGEGAKLLVSRG